MKIYRLAAFLSLLFVVACTPVEPAGVVETDGPVVVQMETATPAPPAPAETAAPPPAPTPTVVASDKQDDGLFVGLPYEPQPEDDQLERQEAEVTLSELIPDNSVDSRLTTLHLQGHYPTPCHQLRIKVNKPNQQGQIHVEVYSLIEPGRNCKGMVQNFDEFIPLEKVELKGLTIWVNGIQVGAATAPPDDGTGYDEKLQRANIMLSEVGVVFLEGQGQWILSVSGSLPTPCHKFWADVLEPNKDNEINIDVYSLVDPSAACIQVIQDFSEQVALGSYAEGTFSVWVNGEKVGELGGK